MFRIAASALALLITAAPAAQAGTFTDVFTSYWALGDSLTDADNTDPFSPPPPYVDGRFSNGPVWAEAITATFEAAGRATGNLAMGGAEAATDPDPIIDLAEQVSIYGAVSDGVRGDRALVSIWIGANDLFDGIAAGTPFAAADAAIDAITMAAANLRDLGVTDLLVTNLPDLSSVPLYSLFVPAAADLARDLTAYFNTTLAMELAGVDGINIIEYDLASTFEALLLDPASFGVVDPVLPCLFPSPEAAAAFGQPLLCSPEEAAAKVFFDGVHPTATIHAAIADEVTGVLTAEVPLPAGLPLLAGALGLFALRRRG